MPAETEQQENLLPSCDARGKYGARPATTECVSSVCLRDENEYISEIMVKVDGEITFLGRAQLDTGSMPSLMSESTAVRAEAWGLTTINRTEGIEVLEGVVKGARIKVEGKVSLEFSVDGVHYYRHTFIVVPDEDRFDILLGAKLLKRCALVRVRQDSTEPVVDRL